MEAAAQSKETAVRPPRIKPHELCPAADRGTNLRCLDFMAGCLLLAAFTPPRATTLVTEAVLF